MRVILQEKIRNLGNIGDPVNVKRGFARNYLIPNGLAVRETAENLALFEKRRAELEKKSAERLAEAQKRSAKISQKTFTLEAQAGDEGKLFGSIGPREIVEAMAKEHTEVAKSEVRMPKGPIRQIGEYDIEIQLHPEVTATIKVNVVAAA